MSKGDGDLGERLRDEEASMVWNSWQGKPQGVQREIDVLGESKKALMRIALARDQLRLLDSQLESMGLYEIRGDLPGALVEQIGWKLDALRCMVEWRAASRTSCSRACRTDQTRSLRSELYSSFSFCM